MNKGAILYSALFTLLVNYLLAFLLEMILTIDGDI